MMSVNFRVFLFVFVLLSVNVALIQNIQANSDDAKTGDNEKTIKRLTTLLNRSGKDYRVKIRITSRGKNDDHSVVYLMATRDADPDGDVLRLQISGDNTPAQDLCLKCLPQGGVSSCEAQSEVSIPELHTVFPGSILPWEEVLVGACGNWVVDNYAGEPTTAHQSPQQYQVRLENAAFAHGWSNTLVTMGTDSNDPLYFDRIDHQGTVLRRIRVLEIGATGSWRGIRRAIIEIPEGRVLMEVVSFRKGAGKPR